MPNLREDTSISLKINGVVHTVPTSFSEVTLNEYLRVHCNLTGTKVMCNEGGCGACIVSAAFQDPSDPSGTGQILQRSINSCMCPILSCDGWEITTIEGIGDQKNPHQLQTSLAEHSGTQCGYCTPGMVMTMYSLLQNNLGGKVTEQQVEDVLDGNICRCTGYRPILASFKTFADKNCIVDLEDFGPILCGKTGKKCDGVCHSQEKPYVRSLPTEATLMAAPWYVPADLSTLYQLIPSLSGKNVYFVAGHTGVGVYNDAPYDAYVSLKGIGKLYGAKKVGSVLRIGSCLPLTDVIGTFSRESQSTGFEYLDQLANLISKTAHVSVRNTGSWGGNLAMKNRHKEFPSDTFVGFAASDAKVVVSGSDGGEKSYSMPEFLQLNMKDKIIVRAELQTFGSDVMFRTYKVMPRATNSHAYVNAAFRAKLDRSQPGQVIITGSPSLVFGNISAKFIHALQTEKFLTNKNLADGQVLAKALSTLKGEIVPDPDPSEADPNFKTSLSVSLFYKFALEIVGNLADPRYQSAIGSLERPLSSGKQSFPTKKENWPLTKPIPKIESMVQCTGEAKFISDIDQEGMLHAAFAVTTEGNATMYKIDVTDALQLPGVLRVLTAADIPGTNNFTPVPGNPEELLVAKQVLYAGQPAAIVIAVSKKIAEDGAKLVKFQYTTPQKPVLTCQDAIAAKSFFDKVDDIVKGDAEKAIASAQQSVTGDLEIGAQAHYHMETMVCVTYPTEDGLNVEAGTQWLDSVQDGIAQCVGISKHRINVTVKRNGGAFGAKITRNNMVAAASAVAAFCMKRPVKMHMSLSDNSKAIGKRNAYYVKYNAGFDNTGKLSGIILNIYCNVGSASNDSPLGSLSSWIDSGYLSPNWKISLIPCKTNLPANTWCRAPGSTESIYFIEYLMEHISLSLKKPSIDLKQQNFYTDGDTVLSGSKLSNCVIKSVTTQLLKSCDYLTRLGQVSDFNRDNRWRKRGMAVVPMRYPSIWNGNNFNCFIAIYHNGGTVAVSHGGVELGQGINTKVAQVVAYELGIDMKYVVIQPTMAITNANATSTGGSITSELASMAAINCCDQLKERIHPVRSKQQNATWEELIETCFKQNVDLSARAWIAPKTSDTNQYNTYGAMCAEVELDVLTGEHMIKRVDLLYDCGESISPLVDVGQVEGAVVMGLGYFTSEEVLYDEKSGQNLTPGTWKYKPPMAKDIPVDFRVALLQNAPNPNGVLRSKLVAEPPLCMTSSVVFALRNAIAANLSEKKDTADTWFRIDAPVTVERAQQYCKIDLTQLRYKD